MVDGKKPSTFDEGVLVGQESWEITGGPTAYEALLDIYQKAGREKSKYIVDSLVFGF
jgi:hypothetical protein